MVFFEHEDIFGWRAMHYASYQGNGIVCFKNGNSDVHVARLPRLLNELPERDHPRVPDLALFSETGPCLLK